MSRVVLAAFMAAGAASGLAVGLALLDARDGAAENRSGPSVGVATDRAEYARGEPVLIRISNTGTVPLPGGAWTLEVTGLSGMRMYAAAHYAGGGALEPGDLTDAVWNQTKDDGRAVLEGLYRISVRGPPGGPPVHDSTVITILK